MPNAVEHCPHFLEKVMKYIKQSVPNNSTELVRQCLSGLKKINLDLTEGELIQIANHVPLFPVEIHLVNRLTHHSKFSSLNNCSNLPFVLIETENWHSNFSKDSSLTTVIAADDCVMHCIPLVA